MVCKRLHIGQRRVSACVMQKRDMRDRSYLCVVLARRGERKPTPPRRIDQAKVAKGCNCVCVMCAKKSMQCMHLVESRQGGGGQDSPGPLNPPEACPHQTKQQHTL